VSYQNKRSSSSTELGVRVCLFELAGHAFGVRLESVSEIVPMAALSHPPSMPRVLAGFLNLRGTSLPVLKLAALLGVPEPRLELHTPLVIVRHGSLLLALLVDRVTGIVSVPAGAHMSIAPSGSFNGCVAGQLSELSATGDAIHLLSIDRLLLENERRILAEFQATETTRLSLIGQVPS
jgi:chemotaxis signal transduction protein